MPSCILTKSYWALRLAFSSALMSGRYSIQEVGAKSQTRSPLKSCVSFLPLVSLRSALNFLEPIYGITHGDSWCSSCQQYHSDGWLRLVSGLVLLVGFLLTVLILAIIHLLFPNLNFISSLAIAACLTSTDPIVCAAIVGGSHIA